MNSVNIFAANTMQTVILIVLLVVMVIVLVFLPMIGNKQRAKTTAALHSSLGPGDVIKTVGGIVGVIKEINDISPVDKEMVVETGVGDNKSTMVFDIQAVYQVVKKVYNPPAPEPVVAPATADSAVADTTEATPEPAVEEKVEEPAVAEPVVEEPALQDETVATSEKPKKTSKKKN